MKKISLIIFMTPAWLFSQTGVYTSIGGGCSSGSISSIAYDSITNEVYVAGAFNNMGGAPISYRAKWNGYIWDSIPELPNTIEDFKCIDGDLYAYGYQSLWQKISNVWTLIATTNSQHVTNVEKYEGKLLIMGAFDSLNGQPFNSFALYDGSGFAPFSESTVWSNRQFYTSAVYNGELYVGGNFSGGSGTLRRFMKWDGSQWIAVGGSFAGSIGAVAKLVVFNGKLYAGGSFTMGAGHPGNAIFSYDGTNYDDLDGGLYLHVFDMAVHDDKLFITGPCKAPSGREFKGFLTYDGADFCFYDSITCNATLGSSFLKLGFYNDTLIVGGARTAFNGDTIKYIGRYIGDFIPQECVTVTNIASAATPEIGMVIYPNPVGSVLTIKTNLESSSQTAHIIDILGRRVMTLTLTASSTEVDVSALPKGAYFLHIQSTSRGLRFIKN